jgi:PadR family transcriptional regulator PadR
MPDPQRITGPLLSVLEVLLRAGAENEELHGWAVKKEAGLSGATTYKMFDRLEDAGWITGRWAPSDEPGKPARRYYRLTPTGTEQARTLLAQRRPEALRSPAGPRPVPGLSVGMRWFGALGRRQLGGAQ